MKKKGIILWASIIGLIIVGYTSDRVYHSYQENSKPIINSVAGDKKGTNEGTAPDKGSNSGNQTSNNTSPKDNSKNDTSNVIYKIGDKGDKIKEIQERLIKYGYDIEADGDYGNQTYYAVLDFQTRLNLTKDGSVGTETLAKLNEEPTDKTKYTPPSLPAFSNTTQSSSYEKFVDEKGLASNTIFLIWVDLTNEKVNLFTGTYKNWHLIKSMSCSSGKASTPTVTGSFTIESKGEYFRVNSQVICKYYCQFYGNYLFHTVLLDNNGNIIDGTLGTPVSHGCIRLAIEDAKYIYDNVTIGTLVYINK